MSSKHQRSTSLAEPRLSRAAWLTRATCLGSLPALLACQSVSNEPPELVYVCGTSEAATFVSEGGTKVCGADDPKMPPEPTLPAEADVCMTLKATKVAPTDNGVPDETVLDTPELKAAFAACAGKVVRLVPDGDKNAFVTGPFSYNGLTLWIDKGVTLYASRDPAQYALLDAPGLCGKMGVNNNTACTNFITIGGNGSKLVGEGVIDGQGDQPLIGRDYSWWQLSQSLRETNGSIGNPSLIVVTGATGFVAYKITLVNSPKFHMKIGSKALNGCDPNAAGFVNGAGFIVWGVTVLTPSRFYNSVGEAITPFDARNTDALDPGSGSATNCGVIACSTLSTSDDHIAIKGGQPVYHLVIAHNHFGTGHGMSIGSETYSNVDDIDVYDLTIDNDSRPEGEGSSLYDSNGIRIKSDLSRGGKVTNVSYRDVCMRDVANAIMLVPSYNPLFSGTKIPEYSNITFQNVRHVSCMNPIQPVVTFHGFSDAFPMTGVNLDNVWMDNIGPQAVSARYAQFNLGGGNVNFTPAGVGVTVNNNITNAGEPPPCVFPKLPTQRVPSGWLR